MGGCLSSRGELIAAIDIGKTHSRVSFINPRTGAELWSARQGNRSLETPIGRQLDVVGIEQWLVNALRTAPGKHLLMAVVPIAHGAAAVLMGAGGEILAVPDYEDARFERVNAEYDALRDPFEATCSPSLPLGLNLGRQLFYLEQHEQGLFRRIEHILPYPQFWAWRLSGVMACEVSSLGCHSDLWRPQGGSFSALAQTQGWAKRFAPNQFAGEALGTAIGPVAEAAGLPPYCKVVCGIHDSNASYLRHLIGRREQPFAVVSSGTWTVVMAHRAALTALRAERDMLANVDVFGTPVPTARFMGGREYEAIASGPGHPSLAALNSVLEKGAMALPSFAPAGPFAGRPGKLLRADALDEGERATLAMLYVALMTELSLDALGAHGEIIVDGPLATHSLFGAVLATLTGRERVWRDEGQGTTQAICYLAGLAGSGQSPLTAAAPLAIGELLRHRAEWRQLLA
jgi:L-fuculokinase